MDWSLFGCGRSGHLTYAPDEPDVRERLCVRAGTEEAWQCLRCGTFVIGPPGLSGPASQAPTVRRGKELRSALILRVFAVERFLRAVVAAILAFFVWRLQYSRQTIEQAFDREIPLVRELFHQFGYNIDNSKLVGLIQRALTLSPTTIEVVAIVLAVYAVIELFEGTGLWLVRRWGEYFAMVATSLGLPYEIFDLVAGVTVTRVALLIINLALVLYLVITKRLFGVRGGKRAYEARLRSESIMDAAVSAAAAGQHATASPASQDRPVAAGQDGEHTSPPAVHNDPPPAGEDARPGNGRSAGQGGQEAASAGQQPAVPADQR